MRIFVINLARRKDRLAHMARQLTSFERIDAVDGRIAARPKIAEFRFWCAKGYRILPGEIGCVMSHRIVYRRMLDGPIDAACVLEDDVTLCSDFALRLDDCMRQLRPDRPEVLSFTDTTAAYLVNRRGAELLLRANDPICAPADDWRRWVRRGLVWRRVDGCVILPEYGNPALEGVGRSDIIGDARHLCRHMSFGRKLMFRCGRLLGKSAEGLLGW